MSYKLVHDSGDSVIVPSANWIGDDGTEIDINMTQQLGKENVDLVVLYDGVEYDVQSLRVIAYDIDLDASKPDEQEETCPGQLIRVDPDQTDTAKLTPLTLDVSDSETWTSWSTLVFSGYSHLTLFAQEDDLVDTTGSGGSGGSVPTGCMQIDVGVTYRLASAGTLTLYARGESACPSSGHCQITVTGDPLKSASGGTDSNRLTEADVDGVTCTVMQVDLDIAGIGESAEEVIGGLVVKNADDNAAPRQQIIIQAIAPADLGGNVVLTKNSSNVRVFDAATGGTEITFNGTDNVFAVGSLPKSLYVQGADGSGTMRDISLKASHETALPDYGDVVKFTTLWVDPVNVAFSGPVSNGNDKREDYKDVTVADTYDLGLQHYDDQENEAVWIGWGFEVSAQVHPSDFSYPLVELKLERDAQCSYWLGSEVISNPTQFSNDTSHEDWRDDDPVDSDGMIYDIDSPGIVKVIASAGEVRRVRDNFRSFASVTIGTSTIRCSTIREYYVRFSAEQMDSPAGTNWQVISPPDVSGDGQAGYGTTVLSWDLQ